MSETSKLFGHKTLFSNLIYLDQIEKFPNKILLNGPKGIGKKLLVSHLLNYLYSKNNEQLYNFKNNEYNINNNLSSLISTNSHPNIFKVQKKKDKKIIDIDQIREMIQFTNQTSFNNDRRFIVIEDINLMGINSANALLKSIEEPNNQTYYILINTMIGLALGPYFMGQLSDMYGATGMNSAESLQTAISTSLLIFFTGFCLVFSRLCTFVI